MILFSGILNAKDEPDKPQRAKHKDENKLNIADRREDSSYKTTFYRRVESENKARLSDLTSSFRISTGRLMVIEPPELIYPPDNSQNISTLVELVWSSVPGAFYFHVQLSKSMEFSDLLIDSMLISDTTMGAAELDYSTMYYWRVKGAGELLESDWSQVFGFETSANPAIKAPELISPPDNSQNVSTSVELVWGAVPGTFYFQVQLSESINFSDPLIDTLLISDTTLTAMDLNYSTTYYWRVKGIGELIESSWSEPFSFITETPVAIERDGEKMPSHFQLNQNFPNPFSAAGESASGGNPTTTITYSVASVKTGYSSSLHQENEPFLPGGDGSLPVKLVVYDILGREVATLVKQYQRSGTYEVKWDATGQATGVYFYRITAGNFTDTKKMLLVE